MQFIEEVATLEYEEWADNKENNKEQRIAKKIEKNKDLPPEQVLRNERALLAEGIPGDPFLKQPWTDRFGGVGK